MIFEAENWILYIGLAVGILFCIALCYFFKYQEYKKNHPQKEIKFEVRYVVAAVCTLMVASIIAYVITFYGLGYVAPETKIAEGAIAFIIALALGGFTTFIVDACVFHPIVDGTAAMAFNKAQEKVRQDAMRAAEELKTKEAQEAILNAIRDKVKALAPGLSEKKIDTVVNMMKGEDDPNLPLYILAANQFPDQ